MNIDTDEICKAITDIEGVKLTPHDDLSDDYFFDITEQTDKVKDAAALALLYQTPNDYVTDIAIERLDFKKLLIQSLLEPNRSGIVLGHEAYCMFETQLRQLLWDKVPQYMADNYPKNY